MTVLPLLVSLSDEEESLGIMARELIFSDAELTLAKALFAQRLPPLVKPDVLPFIFGISHGLIGLMEKFPDRFYRCFTVEKSNGGLREIKAPRRFLKTIQRWIHRQICLNTVFDDCVVGFVEGKNIFDMGRAHVSGRNLMVVDIADFFPSISFSEVEEVFKTFGFPNRVAHQLSALCCLDERLPQGAPTSPALANLVFRPVDATLKELGREWGCVYTRYADDLAFSGTRVFSRGDRDHIGEVLSQFGFSINEGKSRIIGQGGRQVIAGLVVNQHALPLRSVRRRWRAIFHRASRYPREFDDRVHSLAGIIAFTNQFSPTIASNYRRILEAVIQSKPSS